MPESRSANGLARGSLLLLLGVPVGIAFLVVWSVRVDTSSTLSDEERIRGWGTVVREPPATLFLVGVVVVGMVLAVAAGRRGAIESSLRAIWLHCAALFFVLLVVMNGSADNIMETRTATVKWMLFPAQIVITSAAVYVARRMATSQRRY